MDCHPVSSTNAGHTKADAVIAAVTETWDYSLREAGELLGVSQTKVSDWRAWIDEGADPAKLPSVRPSTMKGLTAYLSMSGDIEARRTALTLAADRLDELASELRREAALPDAATARPVNAKIAERLALGLARGGKPGERSG